MSDPAVTCTEMPGSEFIGGCTTDMLPSGEESDAARAAGHLLVEYDKFDYAYYLNDLESIKGQWIEDRAFYPSTMTYSLTFVLGLLGNFLVVFALYIDRKAHNVTSSFMASLAIADILFLVVCVPYETAKMFMFAWVGGLALCKMVSFVEMLSALASVLNLTAVSVERYIVIVHPMKSRSWCTMGNTYKTILGIWIIALLLSSPTLQIMKTSLGLYYNNHSHVTTVTCGDNNVNDNTERIAFVWYQLLVMFIIPILIILYCYSIVIRVLWISTREHAQLVNLSSHMTGNDVTDEGRRSSHSYQRRRQVTVGKNRPKNQNNDVREARKQIIRMLMTIVAIFFCCWGPKLVLNVMKRHQTDVLHNDAAFYVMLLINLLPYIQSCMNPVIYCFMSNKFRRSMRTTCRCGRRCCCSGEGGLPRDAPVTDGDLTSLTAGRGKLSTAAGASQSRTLMSQTDYSSSVLNPEYSSSMNLPGRSTTYISVVSDY